jgi:hypothetical protein
MRAIERKRKLIRRKEDKRKQWQLIRRRARRAEDNRIKRECRVIRLGLQIAG